MSDFTATHDDIFITRLWRFRLESLLEHHPEWIAHILARSEREPEGANARSVRRGWKSDHDLFVRDDAFAPLHAALDQCVKHVIRNMKVRLPNHYHIKGSLNLAYLGGYNQQHGHSNVLLAGVYYLQVPKNSGALMFMEPRPAAKYGPLSAGDAFSSNHYTVRPKAGEVLLFPGWLEHAVESNDSDMPRISVPFNVVAGARRRVP